LPEPERKPYTLLRRAHLDGQIREPGYKFFLADNEIGPHETVQGPGGRPVDKPLYEPFKEPPAPPETSEEAQG